MPMAWSSLRAVELLERLLRTDQRDAAARDHAFLDGRTGRVQRVFDAGLLFLHLDLGGRADLDHGDAAGELGHALLQLLLVVVGGGFLDLLLDLGDARLDLAGLAVAVDDRGVLLLDHDLLGLAQVGQRRLLEREADFLGDHGAAGQDGDVLQHGLAAVAEARGLHGRDLDDATDGVDDQRRQRLTLDVLGDRPAADGRPWRCPRAAGASRGRSRPSCRTAGRTGSRARPTGWPGC